MQNSKTNYHFNIEFEFKKDGKDFNSIIEQTFLTYIKELKTNE